MFDTFEEASDLIVQCGVCDKPRMFSVIGVHTQQGTKYELERCSGTPCAFHCQCGIPSLRTIFDHGDLQSAVSMYV